MLCYECVSQQEQRESSDTNNLFVVSEYKNNKLKDVSHFESLMQHGKQSKRIFQQRHES